MYYVDHVLSNGNVAVANTKDNVIELLSKEEYERKISNGLQIFSWEQCKKFITSSLSNECSHRFYSIVMKRDCECIVDYLKSHSVYDILSTINCSTDYIDWSKPYKEIDYLEIRGYYALVATLHSGNLIIIKVFDYGVVECLLLESIWYLGLHPSCSGYCLKAQSKKNGVNIKELDDNTVYVNFFSRLNIGRLLCVNLDRLSDSILHIMPNVFA